MNRTEQVNGVHRYCKKMGFPVEETEKQRLIGPKPGVAPPSSPHAQVQIKNLPSYLLEDDLMPFFSIAGPIYRFKLMLKNEDTNNGSAFVTYENEEYARKAILNLNGREIGPGSIVSLERITGSCKVFVGGLPVEKTKDEIWRELKRGGTVGIIEVIVYRSYTAANRNRGFAFVEFSTHDQAAEMIKKCSTFCMFGHQVVVNWAKSTMKNDAKVKKLVLNNLSAKQSNENFALLVTNVLGFLQPVKEISKSGESAFVDFNTRRDAQRGFYLLREYYRNIQPNVDVIWEHKDEKSEMHHTGIACETATSNPHNESTETKKISEQDKSADLDLTHLPTSLCKLFDFLDDSD